MTKKTHEYQETVTRQTIVAVICDRCGAELPKAEHWTSHREFTLRVSSGKVFPEGGWTRGWKVEDLCDQCVLWLRETLETAGVKVEDFKDDF